MRLFLLIAAVAISGCMKISPEASRSSFSPDEIVAPVTIPEALIENLQDDLEISEPQAAAIAGNLAHETGNFTMLQQIGGPSFGYSQWLGSRRTKFYAFARKNGGRHSFEANYGFLIHEIKTEYGSMMERIRRAEDVSVASRIFMREFLRPNPRKANLNRRVRFSHDYLQGNFSGSGCKDLNYVQGDRIQPCTQTDLGS